jgi:4-amino-4-deoxy-L-arabinose transferase-like glycosyltransferase
MLPQSLGIPVVVVCAAALAAAFWLARMRRPRAALAALLAAAALLRLFASSDRYLHEWDERYHALVAKNMIAAPFVPVLYDTPVLDYDYRAFFANHVWLHKPPLTLWLMALSMKAFGVNELAVRLPSLVLGTLSVLLTFLIARRLFDEPVALLAASLHAINGLLLDLGAGRMATDHPDTALIFLVTLGGYLAVRASDHRGRESQSIAAPNADSATRSPPGAHSTRAALALIGLCTGAALLTKSIVAGIIPLLWSVAAWRSGSAPRIARGLAIIAGVAVVVAGPWILYVQREFPREAAWESHHNWLHVVTPLDGHGHGPFWYLYRLGRDFGELVYVPLAWFLLSRDARARGHGWALLRAWFIVPYVAFSLAATKMPGYVAIAAPAIFMMTALFCERLWAHLTSSNAARPRPRGVRIAGWAILILALGLPARYTIERLRPSPSQQREKAWAQPLRGLDARFPGERVVLFNCERPIEAMFYSSHIAYPQIPSAAEIERIERAGYRAVILPE